MSNEEKKRRELYRKKRKKWISIQVIIIFVVALLSGLSFYNYNRLNETHYVKYTETSSVDYNVYLFDNDFLDKEYPKDNDAYVTELVDRLNVKFNYELAIDADKITYDYSYLITTRLLVTDKDSNKSLLDETEKNKEVLNQKGAYALLINDMLDVHFAHYNERATSFVRGFKLSNTESKLIVSMSINISSKCAEFEEIEDNKHVISLNIPLNQEVVNIEEENNSPMGTTKILACKTDINSNIFKYLGFIGGGFDVLLVALLIGFIYFTRNHDIDYTNKLRKILANYKSYIQKIDSEFNTKGYQVLKVSTFNELLEIRDTIQKPILMNENEDKTCAKFIVPNDSLILYLYELKVENYDELYGNSQVEEPVVEGPVVEEPVVEETVEEVVDEPIVEEVTEEVEEVSEEEIDEITEEEETTEGTSNISYNYSFAARLTLADYQTKLYYENIVKFAMMHNVKIARSWKKEKIYFGRKVYANLVFRGSKLCVALALDPKKYEDSKYRFIDVSQIKRFSDTPMMMKLTSDRKQKHTLELLETVFDNLDVGNATKPFQYKKTPYRSRQALIRSGLIKVKVKETQEV